MGDYRLTFRAESDLAQIADYTIEKFGIEQARRYRDVLDWSGVLNQLEKEQILRCRPVKLRTSQALL